jgi:ribosomal protein L29
MKQKIKEALQQEYKNLGLNDEAFERVAAFGETLGINEESLANFVKGANDTLKKMQSDADKVRNAKSESSRQVEELKAKLAELEAQSKGDVGKEKENIDFAKIIAEAVATAVQPLQDKLASIEGAKSAEDAYNSAKKTFFGNEWTEKYIVERDTAWKNASKNFERLGKKMSAEELTAEANELFNDLVSIKGVDATKPFKSEGNDKDLDFSEDKEILVKEGLLKG